MIRVDTSSTSSATEEQTGEGTNVGAVSQNVLVQVAAQSNMPETITQEVPRVDVSYQVADAEEDTAPVEPVVADNVDTSAVSSAVLKPNSVKIDVVIEDAVIKHQVGRIGQHAVRTAIGNGVVAGIKVRTLSRQP